MRKKQPDSFWLSYADLMTSLFFIMLVLFVVCVVENAKLQKQVATFQAQIDTLKTVIGKYQVQKKQYERLLNLEATFRGLNESSSLSYIESNKAFVAKDFQGIEIFEANSANIKTTYLPTVDKVGKDLQALLGKLNEAGGDISYLLIIEGNAANTYDSKFSKDDRGAYNLSYQRALALYNHWHTKGINLRQYNTEIQICGSGMNGSNRDSKVEENNKRFIIQIIPKISRSEPNK